MRVALYIRVSTEEQADGFSLDAQERACRAYAELRGWEIYQVYKDDGYSGRSSERPALTQLTEDIKAKRVKAVIIHKLDRLARNLHLMLGMINEWDACGCAFVSISEQMDFSTPMGRMVLQLLGAVAEWYSNNLSAETKKGLAEKQRQGGWVGPVPYGYRMAGGRLVVDANERTLVLEMYQRYATGLQSYGQIATAMNIRGHDITDYKRSGRHLFSEYSIRSILGNRVYLGLIQVAGVDYPGTHEAIITPDLWSRVEDVRKERAGKGKIRAFGPGSESPLHGLIRCARCGSAMHWSPRRGGYGYYRCNGVRARICTTPKMASWQRLSAQVEEQLQQLSIPAEHHAQITRLVAAELAPAQPARQTTSEQIQERRRRLARIYADGLIGEQAYSAEMAELNAQLAAEPETPASVSMDDIADAVSWLSKMPALYARANTTERAQLLQLLFTTLWVDEGQLTAITPRPLYLVVAGCFVRIATPGRDQRPIRTKLLPLWLPNRQAYVRIGR